MRRHIDKEERYRNNEGSVREKSMRETETDELEFVVSTENNWWQVESEALGMEGQYFSAPRDKELADILKEGRMQEAEQARDSRKYMDNRKKICIDIIIDGTYSFSKIFLKVNYVIERIVRLIQEEKVDFGGIVIKYGLTVLHEAGEPCYFRDKEFFTESEDELLQKILDIRFHGGNANGREDLKDALDTGLSVLNNYTEEDACRGLLMFSDSLPEEKDMHPDFFKENQIGYINKGLRFAVIYTYDDRFTPKLKMVDRDGEINENGRNDIIYGSINELLSSDRERLTEEIRQVVSDILKQTSVRL